MADTDFGTGYGPARIGVSSCLLGQNTRHDGGNRLDPAVVELIETIVEPAPICPEMEIGMGSPRPPIQLVDIEGALKARGVNDPSVDVTIALEGVGSRQTGLSGFILKSRSPSCGVASSNVFSPDGSLVSSSGSGTFARAVMRSFPLMPIVEETAVSDPASRDAFILRVFVYDLALRFIRRGSGGAGEFVEKTMFVAKAVGQTAETGFDVNENEPDSVIIQKRLTSLMNALTGPFPSNALTTAVNEAVGALSQYKRGTAR